MKVPADMTLKQIKSHCKRLKCSRACKYAPENLKETVAPIICDVYAVIQDICITKKII